MDVLVEGIDEEDDQFITYIGRTEYDAPEIDGSVIFRALSADERLEPGTFVSVLIEDAFDYDLVGTLITKG